MKAIIIKGLGMPEENGFVDARIYGNGKVLLPCGPGELSEVTAEEIEIPDEK